MIQSSRALVLHQLKFSETSIIVTLYTEAFGRQSYIVNGIRSAKSKVKMGLLQPLFLLDIEAYHKSGRDVQRMKEFKAGALYQTIPFEIGKSTIALFLAELLSKVLKSEEPDPAVFDFIHHSLIYFDSMEEGASNFHLWFLVKMLGYLGFQLNNNHSPINVFFDVKAGCFVKYRPSFPNTPNTEESAYIAQIIDMDVDGISTFSINGDKRSALLNVLVECYTVHFESTGSINSLKVLQEIFH